MLGVPFFVSWLVSQYLLLTLRSPNLPVSLKDTTISGYWFFDDHFSFSTSAAFKRS